MDKNIHMMQNTPEQLQLLKMRSRFTKQLAITAVVAVVACVSLFGVGTWAWFASNKTVTSEGMNMEVDTNVPSLIIKGSAGDINTAKVEDIKYVFDNAKVATKPAMYANGAGKYNLQYVADANLTNVSGTTGKAKEGALVFTPVADGMKDTYCKDFTVYLASFNTVLTGVNLVAQISTGDDISDEANVWRNATAIDFYVKKPNEESASYGGTVHLKANDNRKTICTDIDVPLTTAGSIEVTMRCYFDGNLDDGSNAYIRSSAIPTVKTVQNIKVTFTAEDKPSSP